MNLKISIWGMIMGNCTSKSGGGGEFSKLFKFKVLSNSLLTYVTLI